MFDLCSIFWEHIPCLKRGLPVLCDKEFLLTKIPGDSVRMVLFQEALYWGVSMYFPKMKACLLFHKFKVGDNVG